MNLKAEKISHKSKFPETNIITSNDHSVDMKSNKSTTNQRGDKLNFYDKFRKINMPGIKRLSSPLFSNQKIINKNKNEYIDYVSPKNRASLTKGIIRRNVMSASPQRNKPSGVIILFHPLIDGEFIKLQDKCS